MNGFTDESRHDRDKPSFCRTSRRTFSPRRAYVPPRLARSVLSSRSVFILTVNDEATRPTRRSHCATFNLRIPNFMGNTRAVNYDELVRHIFESSEALGQGWATSNLSRAAGRTRESSRAAENILSPSQSCDQKLESENCSMGASMR